MRKALAAVCLFSALVVPAIAHAEDPPPLPPPTASTTATASGTIDTVHLRNGGMFRGHVTEIIPGDHVTIVVEGKAESRRIPWPEVERVIVASTAVPPPPTASTPAPATPPTPAPMVGPKARVHITSPKQVLLYRRPSGSTAFVQQCTSPCNEDLPIGDTYRVTGNGVAQSKEFHLEASPGGTVDVVVDPPSTGGMIFGGFMAGGGATAAYVGLLMTLVGAAEAAKDCNRATIPRSSSSTSYYDASNCEDTKETAEVVRNVGLVTMGVGAVLTAVGIVVFLNNAGTDITQKGASHGDAKADPPRALDAYLRVPDYRGKRSSAENAVSAPPAVFPLLYTAHF
jgi:hypothetical protein